MLVKDEIPRSVRALDPVWIGPVEGVKVGSGGSEQLIDLDGIPQPVLPPGVLGGPRRGTSEAAVDRPTRRARSGESRAVSRLRLSFDHEGHVDQNALRK